MEWEKLTAPEFQEATRTAGGVCILPFGVLEKHGDHLPLGTDALTAHAIAVRAAEQEPALVFPLFYFGMNTHAKCEPGAFALKFELLLPVLESVCDEIARNGCPRILIYNTHGGNQQLLGYFLQLLLDRPKPYCVYTHFVLDTPEPPAAAGAEAEIDGHAGELETSILLYEHPDLVKGQPGDYGRPRNLDSELRRVRLETATRWYADHPRMLRADRTPGSAEKGRRLVEQQVRTLVAGLRAIKQDEVTPQLYREFLARCRNPESTLQV